MNAPIHSSVSAGVDFLLVSSGHRDLPDILEKLIRVLPDERRHMPRMYNTAQRCLVPCQLALEGFMPEKDGPLAEGFYFSYKMPRIFSELQVRTLLTHMQLEAGDVYNIYYDGVPSKAMMIESDHPSPAVE